MNTKNTIPWKKLFSLLLAAIMMSAAMTPATAAVANPAFDVRVTGVPEVVNGKSAFTVAWRFTANVDGLRFRGSSGLRLAYDNTVLQLMRYSGAGADYILAETLGGMPSAGSIGVYEDAVMDVRACRSADSTVGYVTIEIGHSEYTYGCERGVEETLASIRFAFRDGKSKEDIRKDSIRLMTISEMESRVQPAALNFSVASGGTNVEYVYRSRFADDSLNAPVVLPDIPGEKVPVTLIQINAPIASTVERGGTYNFRVTLNEGALGSNIVWLVSNPLYATVSSDGAVTVLNRTGTVILIASDTVSGLSHSIVLRIV